MHTWTQGWASSTPHFLACYQTLIYCMNNAHYSYNQMMVRNRVFHAGIKQRFYKGGSGEKWRVSRDCRARLRFCCIFCLSGERFSSLVSVRVFFFFCTHWSISHLFISLWKEVNALFLTQGYCEVKEMHLFYELAVLLVSMIFSPVIP